MLNHELNQLIRKAKQGSQESFAELVERYKGHVFRHAYAMVNDRMEAEDISQEAFVKAFYSLSRLDNEYAFVSWLTRIVSNLCYDSIEKAKKKKTIHTEEIVQDRSSPIEQSHLKLTIEEGLQKLSPEHRTVLVMRDIQGFPYNEIADSLGIPLGTVKSRISTARLELKNELLRGENHG